MLDKTKTGNCQRYFKWKTTEACHQEDKEGKAGTCSVLDDSGHMFNLSSLATPYGYNVTGNDDTVYHLNVCADVPLCKDGMAACSKDKQIGKVSKTLDYKMDTLTLTYRLANYRLLNKDFYIWFQYLFHTKPLKMLPQ